jgi:osmotically-inducible protein OsmY
MPTRTNDAPPSPCDVGTVAKARLEASSYRALRSIQCRSHEGVVILEGRLTTFVQKRMAQNIVAQIEGVERVVNHIEVIRRLT